MAGRAIRRAVSPALRIVARRALELLALLFVVSTLLFFLLRLTGDPAQVMAGEAASPAQVDLIRHQLGLDRPLLAQYIRFLADISVLNFGQSVGGREDALSLVLSRIPATCTLVVAALLLNLGVGISLGAWLGFRSDRLTGRVGIGLSYVALGIPGYVVGLVLIEIFAVQLRWLPSIGNQGPASWLLPTLTLASFQVPQVIRVISTGVASVMQADFVRVALAAGAGPGELLWRHVLKNAVLGATSLIGAQVAVLFSGSVVTEVIFSWPGFGRLLVTAVADLDFPVLQAAVFVVAVIVFVAIAITDMVFLILDPRLRSAG